LKKLLFIIALVACSVAASAQNIDPTKLSFFRYKYGDRMLRLQVDSAMSPPTDTTVNKLGIARIGTAAWIGNGVYWTKAGFDAELGGGGLDFITADRGLHVSGINNTRWGGWLDSIVDIDQNNNGITFHDGSFTHGTGGFLTSSGAYSILTNNSVSFNSTLDNGAGIVTSITHGAGFLTLQNNNTATGSYFQLGAGNININVGSVESNDGLFIAGIQDSAQGYTLQYNSSNGKVTYSASGGGGLSSITADRGLHISGGNNVRWGGSALDSVVDIDQSNNGIIFHDGTFTHNIGDYTGFAGPWGVFNLDVNVLHFEHGADATHYLSFTEDGGAGLVTMQSEHPDGDSWFNFGNNEISMWNANGNFKLPFLIDSAQTHALQYDPATGKVTYALNGGGVDGLGAGLSLNTANGLSKRNDSTAILGGSLDQQTTIDGGSSYTTNFTGSRTIGNSTLTAANTSSGAGFTASSSSGTAISATSTSGIGASIASGSEPLIVTKTTAVTNTLSIIADFRHTTSGTAANGFGGYIATRLEDAAGALQPASYFASRWQSAAAKSSAVDIYNFRSNTAQRVFTLDSIGKITDTTYGYGQHTGTPAYYIATDASGNFIEVDAGDLGGGSGVISTDGITTQGDGSGGNKVRSDTSYMATQSDLTAVNDALTSYVDAKELAGGTTLTSWTNVLSIPGVVANGAAGATVGSSPTGTSVSAAINAWIGSAPNGATLFFPRTGSGFRLTAPIVYPSNKRLHIIVEGAIYAGTSDAFIMDGYLQTLDATKGNIYGTNQTAGAPSYGTQTNTGVWVRSCESCRAEVGEVMGFKYAFQVGGYATGTAIVQGAQFNRIIFTYLRRNSVGVYIHPSGGTTNSNGNWANANGYWGGKIVADTGVLFRPDVTQGDRFNQNNFYQVGFENGGTTSIPMKVAIYMTYAVNNSFFGCRFEPVPITKKLVCTNDVDNTNFFGTSYFQWDWLNAPGNNIHVRGPIYDGVSGIAVGNEADGYRFSSSSTFYNQRILVKGTTRSLSAMANVPANVDVLYTNETGVLITGATYTVLPGIKLVRVNYSAGVASITLPTATSNPNRVIIVKNLHGTNAVGVIGQANIAAGGVAQYASEGGAWIKIN
jgi:hypothetical protein